jgi:hypothetical protein
MIAAAISATSETTGPAIAHNSFIEALDHLRDRQPALRSYQLDESGRLQGESVAPVEDMTDGVAALLIEALSLAERAGGPAPATTVEQVTRENRFLLQANGFFERFPFPVKV